MYQRLSIKCYSTPNKVYIVLQQIIKKCPKERQNWTGRQHWYRLSINSLVIDCQYNNHTSRVQACVGCQNAALLGPCLVVICGSSQSHVCFSDTLLWLDPCLVGLSVNLNICRSPKGKLRILVKRNPSASNSLRHESDLNPFHYPF